MVIGKKQYCKYFGELLYIDDDGEEKGISFNIDGRLNITKMVERIKDNAELKNRPIRKYEMFNLYRIRNQLKEVLIHGKIRGPKVTILISRDDDGVEELRTYRETHDEPDRVLINRLSFRLIKRRGFVFVADLDQGGTYSGVWHPRGFARPSSLAATPVGPMEILVEGGWQ